MREVERVKAIFRVIRRYAIPVLRWLERLDL
jgi:hypothetical protein